MSTAIGIGPFHQKRAWRCRRRHRLQVYFTGASTDSNEYSNRWWAVSPETALEVTEGIGHRLPERPPFLRRPRSERSRLASVGQSATWSKGEIPARTGCFWPKGQKPCLILPCPDGPSRPVERPPTAAIAFPANRRPVPMSTAIATGPFHQKWPWRTSREVRLQAVLWTDSGRTARTLSWRALDVAGTSRTLERPPTAAIASNY